MPLATREQAADYDSQEHGGDDAHGGMGGNILLRLFEEVGDFLDKVAELVAHLLFGGRYLRAPSGGGVDRSCAHRRPCPNGGFCRPVRGLHGTLPLRGCKFLVERLQLARQYLIWGHDVLPLDIDLQSANREAEVLQDARRRSQYGYWTELVLVARLNASRAA
jgi:hypothetical protein